MLVGHLDIAARHALVGWAADRARPERQVRVAILLDAEEIARIPANLPRPELRELGWLHDTDRGFGYFFDRPLPLTRGFNILLRDADTGGILPDGAFNFAPESIPAPDTLPPTAPLIPLLVTSAGRSGSTVLMGRLRGHPAIVLADQPPFEMKQATYYAKAFDVLTSPGNRARSLEPDKIYDDPFSLGLNPYHHHDFESVFPDPAALYAFQRTTAAPVLGRAFAELLTRFYAALAAAQGKSGARYFAEKTSIYDPVRDFVRAVAPAMKEIVLVRDPRDTFLSYRAFWKTTLEFAHQVLRSLRDILARIIADPAADVLVLRYEDLVAAPGAALRRVAAFLDLPAVAGPDPAAVAGLFAGHGTAASPEASIGRWRRELPAAEIARFAREHAALLEAFGYEN